MSKTKKFLLFLFIGVFAVIVIVILFISPITTYLIQKYDEKYTGRQITLDWAYVNPFTGYIHLDDLKVYELKSDSVFFMADDININFSIYKMFSNVYEISSLTLDHPKGTVIQNMNNFNFNDLLVKFSPEKKQDTNDAPPQVNVLKFKIIDGEFHYHEEVIPVNYFIKEVNLESDGMRWDLDTIFASFSFRPGIGTGDVKGNFTINLKKFDYNCAVIVQKLDLKIIEQYLKDLTNYGSFRANIDANLKAKGNFKDAENITAIGRISLNDFHFGKTPKEDYASFESFVLVINECSPKKNLYLFDSVLVNHPYLKYERYDYLDNLQMMFGEKGSNIKTVSADAEKFNLVIEIARYVKILAKNFFQSYYKINRLAIVNGDLAFTDYSLREKFALHLSPMDIWADSIDKDRSWAKLYLKSGFKPYGAVSMDLKINPKDSGDFNINYALQKFPLTVFNPYVITYTSFPLDRGTIEMKGDWSVRNGMIQSENNLLIIDPRITSRLHNKDANYLPLPLIMALVRERGNVIDYEIPITGNLRDPKFHLKDVIFDLLKNIFIKPPTTPYRLQVKSIETEIEKFHSLQWGMTTTSLSNQQVRYVEKITDFLAENPTASISVQPILYSAKEKEYLLFFEAKKKYYLFINNNSKGELNNSDSLKVEKISVKDSMFVKFLDSRVKDSLLFTVQDKCLKLIDPSEINKAFSQLADNRKNYFIQFFEKRNVHNRVQFLSSESTVPYNGFSLYKIMYKGDYPKSLLKAYEKMNDLDSEAPRKKFRKVRYERT